jgi:UPF0755 protein
VKKGLWLSLIISAATAAIVSTYALLEYERLTTSPLNLDETVLFTISPGDTIQGISHDFIMQGWLEAPEYFLPLYARYHQQAHRIQAGEYALTPEMTIPEVIELFVSGKVILNSFTIVEGTTVKELLTQLHQTDRIQTTLTLTELPALMKELGWEKGEAEGWFLPETYHFPSNTSDKAFLSRAFKQMQSVLEKEWQDRAEDLPYTSPYEALIMASIIEKETGIAEERSEIAGVFVRRLQKGMRLQTDPTVIYGMGERYDGNIRRKDLRTDTPYNTYTRHGLPPTPIALPSQAAIHAALHPKAGNTLYFVATGKEGRHVFSSTLQEHNKAVRKYQLKK